MYAITGEYFLKTVHKVTLDTKSHRGFKLKDCLVLPFSHLSLGTIIRGKNSAVLAKKIITMMTNIYSYDLAAGWVFLFTYSEGISLSVTAVVLLESGRSTIM